LSWRSTRVSTNNNGGVFNTKIMARQMTTEDIDDIKSILDEQLDLIIKLMPNFDKGEKLRLNQEDSDFQSLYESILDCNKIITEIVNGPNGKIEKII
jgi:hypothetical protein